MLENMAQALAAYPERDRVGLSIPEAAAGFEGECRTHFGRGAAGQHVGAAPAGSGRPGHTEYWGWGNIQCARGLGHRWLVRSVENGHALACYRLAEGVSVRVLRWPVGHRALSGREISPKQPSRRKAYDGCCAGVRTNQASQSSR